MSSRSPTCRHPDIRKFDGFRSCLACGETIFESPSVDVPAALPDISNPTATATYTYQRLNYELGQEIRLLIVEPGATQDPVRCSLVKVNLLDDPEYEALSYTWATENGDDSLSQTVYCGSTATLHVTKNCGAAIRRLRKPGLRRTLWIDALCIDQQNDAEKNHQVALMGKIYSGAARVLVYLDCDGFDFTPLFGWLRQKDIPINFESINNSREKLVLLAQKWKFFSLRWFHRVWVIQEVALSRAALLMTQNDQVVLDGETVIKLNLLHQWGSERPQLLGQNFPGPLSWIPGWRELERPDLLACLLSTRDCSASDPRDKVFSILNLVRREVSSLVKVDYTASIAAIYIDAAIAITKERGDLSILSYVQKATHIEVDWPSWVPDWRVSNDPLIFQFTTSSKNTWVSQSQEISVAHVHSGWRDLRLMGIGTFEPNIKYCLRVRAHILDVITSETWTSEQGADKYARNSEQYWDAISDDRSALMPTFVKGLTPESEFRHHLNTAKVVRGNFNLYGPSPTMQDVFGYVEPYTRFLEAARLNNRHKLFRTEHSLGFAANYGSSQWMRGDVVVALDGARAPFILHRSEGRYRIASDCYLMAALEYDEWKQKGGRGPWGELPDPVPEEQRSLMIEIY